MVNMRQPSAFLVPASQQSVFTLATGLQPAKNFQTAQYDSNPILTGSKTVLKKPAAAAPASVDGLEQMLPLITQVMALLQSVAKNQPSRFSARDTGSESSNDPRFVSGNQQNGLPKETIDWASQALNEQGEYDEVPETPGGPDTPDSPDTPDTGGQKPPTGSRLPLPLPKRPGIDTTQRPEIPISGQKIDVTGKKPDETIPKTEVAPETPISGKDSPPPADAINAKDFGVVGDGKTDDQAALQKAFDAAKVAGKPLYLGPGTYNHSGVLTLDGAKLVGAGNQTVLNATTPDQAAIRLTGNNPSISNIKTAFSSAPTRSSMPNAAAILIQNASGATVKDMTIQGAQSNGVRIDRSSGSKVTNNLVLGTNADGIAVMNGSSNNRIQNNVVYQASDDSFSDNSYLGDQSQDSGNVFDSNLSLDNAYGRGMAFAGSANATISNNIISGSKWIGIFADTDPNSGTMESTGHKIVGNTVINSPNGVPVQKSGSSTESGTKTSGSVPSLMSILGWDPGKLPDRASFNTQYQPGTGDGANNTPGNRK